MRVEERLDGSLAVRHGGRYLPIKQFLVADKKECAVANKPKTAGPAKAAQTHRSSRRGSDWNKNFDLKKAPKITFRTFSASDQRSTFQSLPKEGIWARFISLSVAGRRQDGSGRGDPIGYVHVREVAGSAVRNCVFRSISARLGHLFTQAYLTKSIYTLVRVRLPSPQGTSSTTTMPQRRCLTPVAVVKSSSHQWLPPLFRRKLSRFRISTLMSPHTRGKVHMATDIAY